MAQDLKLLGSKLKKYREQFQSTLEEVANNTGIQAGKLTAFESGISQPTGDEILILADYFKCDYKFFLSNEKLAPFEQTETLFRKFGKEFTKEDRWAIQECLFLAEAEHFLEGALGKKVIPNFKFIKRGPIFKAHGEGLACELRDHFRYAEKEVPRNIYKDIRALGLRVFRRKLNNSNISGLCIRHPFVGTCVFINYSEDVYRQRFTAAHELAHCILDTEEEVIVSFVKWEKGDLAEIRANTFASKYLMPSSFLTAIPEPTSWSKEKAIDWANKLKVSTMALAIALKSNKLIGQGKYQEICGVRVPANFKEDPELPKDMPLKSRNRKEQLLEFGLSSYYVRLCFEAYRNNIISRARVIELLLLEEESDLVALAHLYNERMEYAL